MLASLLPGLREVRTPLTVGYLWLLVLWLWFADRVPTNRPDGDGLVPRIFDLLDILGPAAGLAALTFVAFLLGALLTIPTEGRLMQRLFQSVPTTSLDVRTTRDEYAEHVLDLRHRAEESIRGLPPDQFDQADLDVARKSYAGASDLRQRLLVTNQELYGEYDRLEAECQFRLNVCLPLLALGVTAAVDLWIGWAFLAAGASGVLLFQSFGRGARSASVIQRAVLAKDITHPLASLGT